MDINLTFDEMPEDGNQEVNPGWYKLTVAESKKEISKNKGSLMLVNDYDIDGVNLQVRFDNFPVKSADGSNINFGLARLKNLLEAVKVRPAGKLTLTTIPGLIKGKSFEAYLDKNDRGYLEVKWDKDHKFKPVEVVSAPTPSVTEAIDSELDDEI